LTVFKECVFEVKLHQSVHPMMRSHPQSA